MFIGLQIIMVPNKYYYIAWHYCYYAGVKSSWYKKKFTKKLSLKNHLIYVFNRLSTVIIRYYYNAYSRGYLLFVA
jgi:hypothetical protein